MSDQFSDPEIEQRLNSTFRPVEPNPEFVKNLGHRLIWHPDSIVIEKIQPRGIRLLAGLLFMTILSVFIWIITRSYRLET